VKKTAVALFVLIALHVSSYVVFRIVGIYRIESGDIDRSVKWISFRNQPPKSIKFRINGWLLGSWIDWSFYGYKELDLSVNAGCA